MFLILLPFYYLYIAKCKDMTNIQEIWKDVIGRPYKISNFGRVFSCRSNRLLKPILKTNGYLVVCFRPDINQTSIHRLVASHFIGNPIGLSQVNHKDGNKQNNHFLNLEWCNQSENNKHAYKIGLRTISQKHKDQLIKHNETVKNKPVVLFDAKGNKLNVFTSTYKAAKALNISQSTVWQICAGKLLSKNYYLEYAK